MNETPRRTVTLTPDELDLAEQLALSIVLREHPEALVERPKTTAAECDALVQHLGLFDETSSTHSQLCPYHRARKRGKGQPDIITLCNCWRLPELRMQVSRIVLFGLGPR